VVPEPPKTGHKDMELPSSEPGPTAEQRLWCFSNKFGVGGGFGITTISRKERQKGRHKGVLGTHCAIKYKNKMAPYNYQLHLGGSLGLS
jgi:hypothetical protein